MPEKKSKTTLEEIRKTDALALALLIYDIYQDFKNTTPDNRDKKE